MDLASIIIQKLPSVLWAWQKTAKVDKSWKGGKGFKKTDFCLPSIKNNPLKQESIEWCNSRSPPQCKMSYLTSPAREYWPELGRKDIFNAIFLFRFERNKGEKMSKLFNPQLRLMKVIRILPYWEVV